MEESRRGYLCQLMFILLQKRLVISYAMEKQIGIVNLDKADYFDQGIKIFWIGGYVH